MDELDTGKSGIFGAKATLISISVSGCIPTYQALKDLSSARLEPGVVREHVTI